MNDLAAEVWDGRSVLLKSFWGWSPETWGTVGWTGGPGLTHRQRLAKELTDPFIAVCYVTDTADSRDPDLRGKIAGFYLMSHETGDRDDFTDALHHDRMPGKWEHSFRALRAFTYVPEHRLAVREFDPKLLVGAQAVAKWGKVLEDEAQIARLRNIPWFEVDVYGHSKSGGVVQPDEPSHGFVRAGPRSRGGYVVSPSASGLPCQLYVLRLDGDTSAFLGRDCGGAAIYKIGLSQSPAARRQALDDAMPRGAFRWEVERTSQRDDEACSFSFEAALAGEYAMKHYLGPLQGHLGGEFYLATDQQIETAWELGHEAARSFKGMR